MVYKLFNNNNNISNKIWCNAKRCYM